jgi:hypothetical protein
VSCGVLEHTGRHHERFLRPAWVTDLFGRNHIATDYTTGTIFRAVLYAGVQWQLYVCFFLPVLMLDRGGLKTLSLV